MTGWHTGYLFTWLNYLLHIISYMYVHYINMSVNLPQSKQVFVYTQNDGIIVIFQVSSDHFHMIRKVVLNLFSWHRNVNSSIKNVILHKVFFKYKNLLPILVSIFRCDLLFSCLFEKESMNKQTYELSVDNWMAEIKVFEQDL